jgi:(p)ppGpp synthase/HD superfamily hydrolase
VDPVTASPPDLVAHARTFAEEIHRDDVRKGSVNRSYFDAHLAPVAELVRGAGGTDVQVAAGYLHDAAEDHGGQEMLDEIRDRFGPEVARIVEDLSDSLADTSAGESKAPWVERKTTYLAHLEGAEATSLQVSAADKLANARDILEDFTEVGDELWTRFNEQRPEAQLWYYASLAEVFRRRIPEWPLVAELDSVVDELAHRVRTAHPDLPQSGPWPAP